MGKGSQNRSETSTEFDTSGSKNRLFKWQEIQKHNKVGDCWIVLNNSVYDVSNFMKRHPGGERIIELYAGQYATVRNIILILIKML